MHTSIQQGASVNLAGNGGGFTDFWRLPAAKAHSIEKEFQKRKIGFKTVLVATAAATIILIGLDLRTSWIESRILAGANRNITFSLQPGPSADLDRPGSGPYDQRLGFATLQSFLTRVQKRGYAITAQARDSNLSRVLTRIGFFPIYHEKTQAGLSVVDETGAPVFRRIYPRQIYPNFASIPPLVVNTILYIENRELRNASFPHRNPAIEWDRLAKAVLQTGMHKIDHHNPVAGGSTLATQLEKMRHSPEGRTGSVTEKFRQIATASVRAYQDGRDTRPAQQRVICDYINSIPLAASPAAGEVIGLADGLGTWYNADFGTVNRLMAADEALLTPEQMRARGRAYREVLSLFLGLRAPTFYLHKNPDALAVQTDRYLRLLALNAIISTRLRDVALNTELDPRPRVVPDHAIDFVSSKAPNAIRVALLKLLGLDNTYALDRLDLTVKTALNKPAQDSVTNFLRGLADKSNVDSAGLHQYQLLDRGEPESVIYSVTLYERGNGANLLRVQTDNYDQPLDINQGTKLQLGSTAKLRTLINYLEIIQTLHDTYAGMPAEELKTIEVAPGDALTQWAVEYLSTAQDRGLDAMLAAALERKYSGSPGEAFFTAGGLHYFENFERFENGQFFTVGDGFQHSVNLVFIRILRDIERYYMYRVTGASTQILEDWGNPERKVYLERFADFEGKVYMKRFYDRYKGQTPDQALETLASNVHLNAVRASVIYRSVKPDAGLPEFNAFLLKHLPKPVLAREDMETLYEKYGPDRFDLQDRGYLAHVHPLELWMLSYLQQHPKATLAEIASQSAPQRQEVYGWLFKSHYKHAQDKRMLTLMEIDAFKQIHEAWKRLGYPFDSLVPSYATAIGVSGDTPAALAQLAGIIMNDGVLYPPVLIQQLHFGFQTPLETIVDHQPDLGKRMLPPIIARLIRREMMGVVQNGTGRRLAAGIKLADGTVLPVGGKTGTGDNRFHQYGAHGWQISEHVVNRTAAFVFLIGDRYFGTVIAFVPGKQAANYGFTSALAVQVLKDLTPSLMPVFEHVDTPKRQPGLPVPSGQLIAQVRP